MSDRAAVAVAAAVALGAHLGGGPTPLVGALLALVAVAARRAWLLCLAAAILAAGLADGARAGLDPVPPGPWRGWATLVTDPKPLDGGGIAVVLAVEGRRVEATAHGPPAWAIEAQLAGERVEISGRLRPPGSPTPWLLHRRVVGRFTIEEVGATARGSPLAAAANRLRRTLESGASGLPATSRSLLTGVVLGDDRQQPPELADDFRAAGLTHLTAVSGQNVAFTLALARPVLAWLPARSRLVATLGLLGAFAVLVRFEPSVIRAGAMAAVACIAAALGRPADGVRVLALAVAAVLLVDPLLIHSVGFGLSVGASAGILLFAAPIAAAVPGPRVIAEPLSVTLAAQAGALPVLVPTFGSVPVATVPANLLAVPAAGPLMIWGLTGGVLAGLTDGPVRAVLHGPTRVLTWWMATVASAAAALPLGELGLASAAMVVAAVGLVALGRWRRAALAVMAAVVASAAAAVPVPREGRSEIGAGVELWRDAAPSDATIAVLGRGARPRAALEALRRAGARCVDVVAMAAGDRASRRTASALARRCPGAVVVAPAGAALSGWQPLPFGTEAAVGGLVVTVDGAGRLTVGSPGHARPGHAAAPRAPPLRHHPRRRRGGDPQPNARLVLRQRVLLRLRRLPAQGRPAGR